MHWDTPVKPAELAEQRIITAILDGSFEINSNLPAERELSIKVGVTRPTLREALQRLSRDGWIEIRQGKPTRVKDFWSEGNLNILSSIARYSNHLSLDFVKNLLQIRYLLCPTYAAMAAEKKPELIIDFLNRAPSKTDSAEVYSEYDFLLHQKLTQGSENPIFTMILNGFKELFTQKAIIYFEKEEPRKHSYHFYQELLIAFKEGDFQKVFMVSQKVMAESILFWDDISFEKENSDE